MRKSNKTTQLITFGLLAVLLVGCGQPKKDNQFFLQKAKDLGDIIIKQASGDINLGNMYNTVWEYAKATEMDFKSAYREMMLDTSSLKMEMENNKQMMDRLMNMVKKPPKNMPGIHEKLIELRESYLEFNKFVLKLPQISQEKFNAQTETYIANINSLKDELDGLISEAEANL
jgi:uncharacterized lipoprotein YehR (DUF1307 family)